MIWLEHVRLVARLRVAERRDGWRRHGSGGLHGEVDDVLAPAAAPAGAVPEPVERSWAAVAADATWRRVAALGLDRPEQELLALLAATQADPRLGRVLGYLDDEPRAVPVTLAAAGRVFGWAPGARPGPAGALVAWAVAQPDEAHAHPWQPGTPWVADPDVVALLCGVPGWAGFWPGLEHVAGPGRDTLHPALADAAADTLRRVSGPVELELVGRPGSGRRTLARAVCARLGRDALVVTHPRAGRRALRTARLLGALPVWVADGLDEPPAPDDAGPAIVCRTEPDPRPGLRISHRVPDPPRAARLGLWRERTAAPAPAAVEAWTLTPADVAAAAAAALAGPTAVGQVLRARLGAVSSTLMSPLSCPYAWDDLVVAPSVRRRLRDVEAQVRLAGEVLDDWGLRRLTPAGRGTTALFAGPSGTGKTMAAQVLARALGRDLHRVDLAEVVNKYIGETEKRLAQVFDDCERSHVMVLFDEADALFGQRTKVRDAHDRFANIEIDFLLQRMETFDGVAVLATNRKGDLDPAFVRRLRVVVDFLAPGPAERLALWERALPAAAPGGAPLSAGVDHAGLAADLVLTGAEIKAIVLAAAFTARSRGDVIRHDDVLAAARREVGKRGAVLRDAPRAPALVNGSAG